MKKLFLFIIIMTFGITGIAQSHPMTGPPANHQLIEVDSSGNVTIPGDFTSTGDLSLTGNFTGDLTLTTGKIQLDGDGITRGIEFGDNQEFNLYRLASDGIKLDYTKSSTTTEETFEVSTTDTSTKPLSTSMSLQYTHTGGTSTAGAKSAKGLKSEVAFSGDGNDNTMSSTAGIQHTFSMEADSSDSDTSYTFGTVNGYLTEIIRDSTNDVGHTITTYKAFASKGTANGSGNIDGTNWYHFYAASFPALGGTLTNAFGLYIENQSYATNDYGIVLEDGTDGIYFNGVASPTLKLDDDGTNGAITVNAGLDFVGIPTGTTANGALGGGEAVVGALCMSDSNEIYVDTDGSCAD